MLLLKTSSFDKETERFLKKKPAVFLIGVNRFCKNLKDS